MKNLSRKVINILAAALMVFGMTPRIYTAYADDTPVLPAPVRQKVLTPNKDADGNEDGTYTLSLSVTGKTDSSTASTVTKANVILVLDTSSSMNKDDVEQYYSVTGTPGNPANEGNTQTQYYRLVNNNYERLYYRNGRWYTSQNGGNEFNGTFYAKTRLWAEKHALTDEGGIIDSLLSQNVSGDAQKRDIIEVALVDFSLRGTTLQNFTTDATTLKTKINGLTTASGTNWEEALMRADELADSIRASQPDEQVYVILLTDGEPSARNGSNDVTGCGEHYSSNGCIDRWNDAKDNARGLITDNDIFYGLFTWGSDDYKPLLQSLIQYAYTGTGDHNSTLSSQYATYYTDASSTSALITALQQIANDITNSVGYTNVDFVDEITSMTNANLGHIVNGEVTGFTYMRSGGAYGAGQIWTDAPKATVTNDRVDWNLGKLELENDVTYTVSFTVWPSQESMDLVADLNNGKVEFDDLTDEQKAQISGSEGSYTLKTNKDDPGPSLTYSTITRTNNNGTITTQTSDPLVVPVVNPDPVALAGQKLSLEKLWEDSLDISQREEVGESVTLKLMRKNGNTETVYLDNLVLEKSKDWKMEDKISIAPGIMISSSDAIDTSQFVHVTMNGKTYYILEEGHEYYFKEEDINKHFELTNYKYHPMLVDGHLTNVRFTYDDENNITGVESSTPIESISATNTIKGGVNISKKVVDENNNEIAVNMPFKIKAHVKNANNEPADYDYRIYFSQNNPNYEQYADQWDENGNIVRSRTGHIIGNGLIEATIYQGDIIRIVNMNAGTIFMVNEDEGDIPLGYTLDSVDYAFTAAPGTTATAQSKTIGNDTYYVIAGNSAWDVVVTNKFTSGNLKIAKHINVTSGVERNARKKKFTFTVDLYSDSSKKTRIAGSYNYTKSDGTTGTIVSGGTVELGDGEYITIEKLPEDAYYEVTETPVAGFAASATGDKGTIVVDATQDAVFTNTYSVTPKDVDIVANKSLTGRAWKDGESFTFTLIDAEGKEVGSQNVTAANEQATFTVPISDVGEYEYAIEETSTLPGGITNSGSISVTVIATDNGNGTLNIEKVYANGVNTIVNTYRASGTATINVTKDLTGRNWIDSDIYSFSLIDKNGTSDTVKGAIKEASAENKNITFDTIEYTLDDLDGNTSKTFYYVIHETTELPDYMSNTGDIKVEVVVTDDGNGKLNTVVTYKDANDEELETPIVTNIYTATGEVELEVTKQLVGRAWLDGEEYEFTLKDATGATVDTGTATANGVVTFDKITYSEADAGKTYTYTISETSTLPDGISKSGDVTATVTVNHFNTYNGKLDISVEYSNNDTIINTYTASGSVTLEAEKKLEGREWQKEESYTFTLSDEDGQTIDSQEVTKDGKVSFQTIDYDLEDVGHTYTYTISETSDLPGGMKKSDDITVTVVVSDNGDGTIKTDVTYTQNDLITNTYSASGSVTIQATKVLEGREWLNDEKYTFALKDADGNTIETKDFTTNETIDFTAINYTKAGEYHYTIEEISTLPNGITASAPIDVTVTVTDNLDGTLDVQVVYSDNGAHTITNTYKASGEVLPQVTKVLEGREWLSADEFSFELKDSTGKVVDTATASATNHIAKFNTISYDESDAGKTYTYTISEVTDNLPAGVTNANNDITMTVEIRDNANGSLDVKATYSNNDQIKNVYGASGEAEINVSKELTGRDWQDDESYVFTLTDGTGTVIKRVTVDGDGEYSFGKIAYTAAGTYTYTISEVSDLPNGLSNSGDITVTVEVTDNLDGTLSSEVSYTNNALITNTYSDSIDAEIRITKVLDGREWLGTDEFKFIMTDENGNTIEASATTDAPTMSFGPLHFTEADIDKTYTYTISEVTDSLPNGVESNSEDITVKVTVSYNHETGKLEVAYDYSAEEYKNTYSANGEVVLEAEKELIGRDWLEGESFTFTLTDSEGTVVSEKQVTENGKVSFDKITYTEAGTYNYTISETSKLPGGMSKSGDIAVTVVVTDNNDGTLTATARYTNGGKITNLYTAAGEIALEATKVVEGREWLDGESFTFALMNSDNVLVGELKTATKDNPKVTFDTIKFDQYSIGQTLTYTIFEMGELPNGMTYSGDITATVTVKDNHDGTLNVTVEYSDGGKITNTYDSADTSVVLHVDKTIEDQSNSQKDSTFTFELRDNEGNLVESKDITTDGLTGGVDFSAINFTEAGEYIYTITEKNTNETGFVYDETEHRVVIDVTDNYDEAKLEYAVTIDGENTTNVEFKNIYKANETDGVEFEVVKTLTGLDEDLEAAEFSFTLYDDEGAAIETIYVTGSGTATFSPITYDQVGTYTYEVKEMIGDQAGYTYDESVYTVTVTVTDVEGQLVAEFEYSNEDGNAVETIEFENTYEAAPVQVKIPATKMMEGRDLKEGEFTFFIYLDDELVAEGTNNADGTIDFSEIEFTEVGTYVLAVFEYITESADGVVFDPTVYEVTVTVSDNGSGKLIAEIEGADNIVFKNKIDEGGKGENPKTYDDIYVMFFVFIVCLLGLIGSASYVTVKKKKSDK